MKNKILSILSLSGVLLTGTVHAQSSWSLNIKDNGVFSVSEKDYSSVKGNATLRNIGSTTAKALFIVQEPINFINGGAVSPPEYAFSIESLAGKIKQGYYPTTYSRYSNVQPPAGSLRVNFETFPVNCDIRPGTLDVKAIIGNAPGTNSAIQSLKVDGTTSCAHAPGRSITYSFAYNWNGDKEVLIASGLSATASSQYSSYYSANNAISGNGLWISAYNERNSTLTVNFPKITSVSKVEAIFYPGYLPRTIGADFYGSSQGGYASADSNPVFSGSYYTPTYTFALSQGGYTPVGNQFRIKLYSTGLPFNVIQKIRVFEKSPYFAWKNQELAFDVNGDGYVSPIDSLLVSNYLNNYGSIALPSFHPATEPMYDVNGDGAISPLDVLMVINYLNGAR